MFMETFKEHFDCQLIFYNGIDTTNDQEIIQNHFAKLYNLLLTWMPKNSWMPASLTCSIVKYDVIW